MRRDFSPCVACRRVGFPPARRQRRPRLMMPADRPGSPLKVDLCPASFPDSSVRFCARTDGSREATLSTVFRRWSSSPRNARQIFMLSSPKRSEERAAVSGAEEQFHIIARASTRENQRASISMPYFPGSRARFPGNFVNSVNRLDSFFSPDEVQVDQLARNESVRSWDELRAASDDPESKKLQRHRYHFRYAHCHQGADGCCARRTVAGRINRSEMRKGSTRALTSYEAMCGK
jgi:hypothetical protein